MKLLAFDLSTACTGVTGAEFNDKEIIFLQTFSIVPSVDKKNIIRNLGFEPSKQYVESAKSKNTLSYVKYSGEKVSKTEKKKRDVMVRNAINTEIKQDISVKLNHLIETFRPDLILAERNESFHGVLTTKLLAETKGILEGAAGAIPVQSYNVVKIRSHMDLTNIIDQYIKSIKDASQLSGVDKITKHAIKYYLERKYHIKCQNTDESDSLAVFDYYYETEVKTT